MVTVLIQGHPTLYDSHDHWMKSFIEERSGIDYPGQVVQYETADIVGGGTHKIDAFYPDEQFHNSFDTLWMPDLGGKWWTQQKNPDMSLKSRAGFLLLSIQTASAVVKPGGHVYVFKFIDQSTYTKQDLIQKIIEFSNKRSVFATAEMIGMNGEPGIHFVKHAASLSALRDGVTKGLRLRINLA